MSKHDRAKQEKVLRNEKYANRYRQYECQFCHHRTSRTQHNGRCLMCKHDKAMKPRRR